MSARGEAISVVVATRDRPEHLGGCLDALCASTADGDEIIVVDSGSRGSATWKVSQAYPVRFIRCERPGASLARNTGWQASQRPIVAFVDDDVRVDPTWAQSLREAFASHPEASFLAGRLGLRDEDADAERPVAFFDEVSPFVIDDTVIDDYGHGANLAVRRDVLVDVGGYNERLGPGTPWPAAEDRELVDRLLARGHRGRYEPTVRAIHVQWRRRPQLLRLEWRYGLGLGARLRSLRRQDRRRYQAVSRIAWKDQGFAVLLRCVRAGYEFEALSIVARLAGTAVGLITAPLAALGAPPGATLPGAGTPGGGRGPQSPPSPIAGNAPRTEAG